MPGLRALPALAALPVLAACASTAPAPAGAPAEPEAPADALVAATYTAEQADRGQRVFGSICSACHGRREFTGPIFELTWMAEPVGNLFQHIRTAMPRDDPGSLSAEEYAAVVAYMLRLNDRPPGDRELPADAEALSHMRW